MYDAYKAGAETAIRALGQYKYAGSKLRQLFQVVEDGPGRFRAYLGKTPLNTMRVDPATNAVRDTSALPPQFENMGLGKKLYGEVMRRMPNQTLLSDTSVSQEARRVWRGMERRPGYTLYEDPQFTAQWPAKRMFSASLPPEAAIGNRSVGPNTPPRAVRNSPADRPALESQRAEDRAKWRR